MSFTVEVISKENIKPSTPTSYQLKNYSLSLIDQHLLPSFIPVLLFYPAAADDNNQHGDSTSILKRSLSETLVHFYPLAGRMKDNIVVDCNDQGVEFFEVKVGGTMCDFLMKPDEQLSGLLPSEAVCMIYVREAQTTIPASRTTSIISPSVSSKLRPTFESASLFPPIKQLISPPSGVTPTLLDSYPSEESKPVSKIIRKRFVFDAIMINSVREKLLALMADKYKCRRPTRVEVVSALIWKSFVKLATPAESSSVTVRHAVNLRKRLDPPLPDVSFGNLIEFTSAAIEETSRKTTTQGTTSSTSSKLHDELNEFVSQLRESISKIQKGDHDFDLENTENGERHLWMSSWCNFGFYDIDFGWGKPIWVTTAAIMFAGSEGLFLMNDTRCGEGIEVWGILVEEDMVKFQHNLSELLDRI
ncbi:hypothetical protein C5167_017958 [Papaver somniferum]|uniref:Uncharacterized protein n=1 Tax=Papaver somniferum TaxID=3469 RepID=A0A4Y7IKX5_PAPSO|nr:hypothetical protein C5167_017958 [Papaver somniferum]